MLLNEKINEDLEEYDVALSFAGEDRAYVQKVAELLKAREVNVFYDDFNQVDLWGKNLLDHLAKIYSQKSRFIVMFISKHYAEKEWTNHERKFAQERALKFQDCILPARFDDTEIPGMPTTVAYADLRKISSDELVEMIVRKVKEENDEQVVNEDDENVLHYIDKNIKPHMHRYFRFELDELETVEYEIESDYPVDIFVIEHKDYPLWLQEDEYDVYQEFFNRTDLQDSFTPPEAGKFGVIVSNESEKKARVQVTISRQTE